MRLLILLLILTGCNEADHLELEQAQNPNTANLRLSFSDVTGVWYFDAESSSNPYAFLAAPVLEIEGIGNDKAIVNGSDTVCLSDPKNYSNCMVQFKLQTGSMAGSILTHCELYSNPVTQTSHYACFDYHR